MLGDKSFGGLRERYNGHGIRFDLDLQVCRRGDVLERFAQREIIQGEVDLCPPVQRFACRVELEHNVDTLFRRVGFEGVELLGFFLNLVHRLPHALVGK